MLFRSADYNGSKWARKESALTEAEQEAIEKHGLFDLSTFLPKKPGEVELKVIKEMFEASVDGQPYDTERWGQYFRPAGVQAPASSGAGHNADDESSNATPAASKPAPAAKPAAQDDDPPFDMDESASGPISTAAAKPASNANDILVMIRARQNKQ